MIYSDDFIKRIKEAKLQKDIIPQYGAALLLFSNSTKFDWRSINNAIIKRWSQAGLESIKKKAWKEIEE